MGLFTMSVKDTFHFADGTTAFVGQVEPNVKFIRPCDCEILVDGEVKGSVRIDGEMIACRTTVPERAISTSERVDFAAIGISRSGFTIRSK
jgi:hypothetical protein